MEITVNGKAQGLAGRGTVPQLTTPSSAPNVSMAGLISASTSPPLELEPTRKKQPKPRCCSPLPASLNLPLYKLFGSAKAGARFSNHASTGLTLAGVGLD